MVLSNNGDALCAIFPVEFQEDYSSVIARVEALRSLGLPLVVVGLGTLWTIGTMHLLGFELTVVSIMVPPLVLTLGSAYSIHILNQYYREARVKDRGKAWIAHSVGHINQTILLAALTTIIGFSSLTSANLSQIKEFGLSTASASSTVRCCPCSSSPRS